MNFQVLPILRHHSRSLPLHRFFSLCSFLQNVFVSECWWSIITASSIVAKFSAVTFSGTRLGSFSRNSFRFSLISLDGLSSSLIAIVWYFSETVAFVKQLTILVCLTLFHADTSYCKAVNNDNFGSGLLESKLRNWASRCLITPWSISWFTDIVFGGKKLILCVTGSLLLDGLGNCQWSVLLFFLRLEIFCLDLSPILQIKHYPSNSFFVISIYREVYWCF